MTTPLQNIETVARALGTLRTEVVFVGGAVIGMLITDAAAGAQRQTDDVDLIA